MGLLVLMFVIKIQEKLSNFQLMVKLQKLLEVIKVMLRKYNKPYLNQKVIKISWGKTENADGSKSWELRGFRKDGRADVNDIYDFSQVPQGYGVSVGYKIPGVSDKLNQWHQQVVGKLSKTPTQIDAKGTKTVTEVDAEVKALRDPIDAQIKAMQDAMTRRADAKSRINAQLTPEKKRLQDIQTRLRGVPNEATLNANKTTLEQNIATNDANITSRQQLLDQAQKNLDKLLNKKRVPKKRQKQHKADVKSARAQVLGHKTVLQGYQATKQRYDADMSKLKAQLQDYADLTPVQANVNRLQGIQSRLGRGNHTNAYNKLQQMLADLQTNHSTVSGVKLIGTWLKFYNKQEFRMLLNKAVLLIEIKLINF